MRKFDNVLMMLERRAEHMGYAIDNDQRYIELCEVITAIDMGEMDRSPAGDKLLKKWFGELLRCFYPDFDEIAEILKNLE